jgi:hypothetical protein
MRTHLIEGIWQLHYSAAPACLHVLQLLVVLQLGLCLTQLLPGCLQLLLQLINLVLEPPRLLTHLHDAGQIRSMLA